MRLKIKQKDFLDILILYFMMIYIFVISWLAYINQGAIILIILILLRLVIDYKHACRFKPMWLGGLFCILYPCWNYIINGGSLTTLQKNIFSIVTPTAILVYAAYLCKYNSVFLQDFLVRRKLLLNGYMLINVPVLILQLLGNTSLSGRHPEEMTNLFADDLISGLFGYNGTGLMTMFFCFLLVYNLVIYKVNRIKYKKIFVGFNILMLIFVAYVAANSDNKAMFIVCPICLIVYFIILKTSVIKNIVVKIQTIFIHLMGVISIILVMMIVLQPFIGTIDILSDIIVKVQNGWIMLDSSYGSAERLGMIAYAIKNSEIRWIGAGIGKYTWQEPKGLNFAHFGINDFGTFICLGGIMFVAILMVFLWSVYKNIFRDTIATVVFLIATVFILIYTQLCTVTSLICSWVFLVMIIYVGIQIAVKQSERGIVNDRVNT